MILIIIIIIFVISLISIECYGNFIFTDIIKEEHLENTIIEYNSPEDLNEYFSKYEIKNSTSIHIIDDNVQFIFFDNFDIFNIIKNNVYKLLPNKLYCINKNSILDIIIYNNNFTFYSNKDILKYS